MPLVTECDRFARMGDPDAVESSVRRDVVRAQSALPEGCNRASGRLGRRAESCYVISKFCGERVEMSDPCFELVIVNGRPTVRGECDVASAGDIEDWLASFEMQAIGVDLSGVTFIDSSGLKAFLNARKRNPNLRVVDPSALVTRLLEMTGTSDYLIDKPGAPA